jgi:hypothetical protein
MRDSRENGNCWRTTDNIVSSCNRGMGMAISIGIRGGVPGTCNGVGQVDSGDGGPGGCRGS